MDNREMDTKEKVFYASVRDQFYKMSRTLHELSQERILLRERLASMEDTLKRLRLENEHLRKALQGTKRFYARSLSVLVVLVVLAFAGFFSYVQYRIYVLEKQVERAFVEKKVSSEEIVGTIIKENYPELYRSILEALKNKH